MKPSYLFGLLLLSGLLLGHLACGSSSTPTSTPSSSSSPASYPDWNITGPATLNAGAYNYGTVHITSNGLLNLLGPSGAATGAAVTLNLTGDFVMDAGASVVGFGAGYGPDLGPGREGFPSPTLGAAGMAARGARVGWRRAGRRMTIRRGPP